jgi:hypothetical protein
MDYRKFSDLGRYLFEEVGPRFRSSGVIEPVDLFMIFIWKANRAKTKTRDKLKKLASGSFAIATGRIAAALSATEDRKERLGILMRDWELRGPMASAFGSTAARLMRAFAIHVEVLRRLRHGGQQFVRVEHVHVNDGGQAVIGNVKTSDAQNQRP